MKNAAFVPAAAMVGRRTPSTLKHAAMVLSLLLFAVLCGFAIPILGVFTILPLAVIAFSVWIAIDFRVGVVAAMILMPLTVLSMFPHQLFGVRGLNPLNVLILVTIVSYVAHAGFDRWRDPILPRRLLLWYLLPITIAALVGFGNVGKIPEYFRTIRSIEFDSGVGYLLDLYVKPLFLVALSVMVAMGARHSKKPERLIFAMIVPGWVFFGLVVFLLLKGSVSLAELASPGARGFIGVLGLHANELSLMLNMLYALTLFTIRGQTSRASQVLLTVSAIIFAVVILLTFSRGGFLGFFLVNAIFFWRRLSFMTVLIGLLVATVIGVFIFDAVMERLLTGVASGDRGAVSAGRLDSIWAPLLPAVLANPITPNGLSSILWSEPIRLNRMLMVAQTHNAWLGGIMDFGLIGFGFMIAFIVFVRREFLRLSKLAGTPALQGFMQGGAVIIPLWFLQGLTDDKFSPMFSQCYFWMALGVLMGSGGVFLKGTKADKNGNAALAESAPAAVT